MKEDSAKDTKGFPSYSWARLWGDSILADTWHEDIANKKQSRIWGNSLFKRFDMGQESTVRLEVKAYKPQRGIFVTLNLFAKLLNYLKKGMIAFN